MPTASYVKIPAAIEDLLETGNAATDQWAIALASSVPASKVFTTGTTDLATAGGYTQGGENVTTTSCAMVGNDLTLTLGNPAAWAGTGPGFTARYALLLNKTVLNGANGTVVAYFDYGSPVVIAAGDTFTFSFDSNAFTVS